MQKWQTSRFVGLGFPILKYGSGHPGEEESSWLGGEPKRVAEVTEPGTVSGPVGLDGSFLFCSTVQSVVCFPLI